MARLLFVRLLVLGAGLCAACGEDGGGEGSVRISLRAEQTITSGLSTGGDVDNSKDYAVSYSKYIVAVGHVQLGRSRGGAVESEDVHVVDLTRVGEQGVEIARFDSLRAGEWDEFAFETPAADRDAVALEVDAQDAELMREQGWTYWIEGTVERPAASGGPVDFVIQTTVPTLFHGCERDGERGLTVVADQTGTGDITIHGDHIWFNSFPTGTEGSVERRAAWLPQADLDQDGKVSTEDLAALDATEVFTTELGYSLDGASEELPIDTALDFVRAQLATQGHFRGEGECIWNYGEAGGEHEHD
jgi:hypothetical protein